MTATIDTFRIVKRLRESGLDERQAETITDVIREIRDVDMSNLVTKADLADMARKSDLIAIGSEITSLRSELNLLEARLRGEIVASRNELMKWLFPALLGQVAVMAALVKLL